MKKTIRLNILFMVGVFLFIGKNAYAGYTSGFGIGSVHPDKYFNLVMSIVAVSGAILTVIAIKACKEGETHKDPNEGTEADESVKNFFKHEQEKPKE